MTETKGDYYPRMNALLQEEEIQRLQVKVNLLQTENALLKGAAQADDERLRDAAKTAEITYFGCDTPEHLADKVVELKQRLSDTEKRLEDALGEAENLRDYRNDLNNNMSFGMLRMMHNADIETINALKVQLAQYEQGNPMLYSPKDGTVILVEVDEDETSYFDIVHWDNESLLWVGNFKNYRVFYSVDEKIISLPKRWFPLPGGAK